MMIRVLKGTITYIYNAAGIKLQKETIENAASYNDNFKTTTTTIYIGAFTYQTVKKEKTGQTTTTVKSLQFIAYEEGRIREQRDAANTITGYSFDYFIKDNLGNVRMVLTDEKRTDAYPDLSFEGAANTQEVVNQDAVWDNRNGAAIDVVNSRTARPGNFGTATSNGSNVMLVRKSTGSIGSAKMLKVMSGDKLNVGVDYYYTATNADNSGAGGYTTFINSLVGILTGSDATGSLVKNNTAAVLSAQSGDANVTNFFLPENSSSVGSNNPPKAYLHILLFDERFVFDDQASYVQQVSYTPGTAATMVKAGLSVKKNGYAFASAGSGTADPALHRKE